MTHIEVRNDAAANRVTIADVAALADVSVPTVSRVLTGAAKVSRVRRERVERAIAELSFRPSAAARALASRRPQVIAIIAGDTSQYGYAEAIRGVEESARASGYTVMITVVESNDDAVVEKAIAATLSQSLAGIIVLKFDPPGVAALAQMPHEVPIVALSGVRDTSVPQAVIDETRAAEELTNYLLDLGHATVHHVRVPASRREDGRTTGWRRALRTAGRDVPVILDATWDPHSGVAVGAGIAASRDVTAVFCGNDEIAMGVIRGITDAGLSVPEDISVVGFDDHPLAALWSPPLTTVDQDFARLGRRGFSLMLAEIAGEATRKYSSERPPVVVRQSAAAPSRTRGGA
ncbi:DNA-binding LacI/PurR family transcriptional regulator [Microbacterium endophyticum]|uniref:DNA-binding LacI/PurR family transcriptional regulator n=1 Tax=Microbacterium endophyticum TaxID=1526412 RepID=A0A7W4V2E6_9MICO|nr:substrate-binding domain-containing protein [Microbacterium endophyticum]MBB2975570.1 DNA-binding LacI/PurR family transcriptional regulator [Microbacterium endophyticum]NIK35411.1 DNA-binding LacI/PurR family transcriptional regulator [Microbacterium endophyticum]